MSVTNLRVLAEVERWADLYPRGEISPRFARPPLSAGERLAVGVFPVRASQQPGDRPFEQWEPRPGARSLRPPFRNDGHFYATSQRIYLVQDRQISRQWGWGDVLAVEVVPNWRGVAIRLREEGDRLLVIGNVFHTFVVRPNPVALASAWLKVQGAWTEWRGDVEFAAWQRLVSARLGAKPVG
jgi:hypothetical protein